MFARKNFATIASDASLLNEARVAFRHESGPFRSKAKQKSVYSRGRSRLLVAQRRTCALLPWRHGFRARGRRFWSGGFRWFGGGSSRSRSSRCRSSRSRSSRSRSSRRRRPPLRGPVKFPFQIDFYASNCQCLCQWRKQNAPTNLKSICQPKNTKRSKINVEKWTETNELLGELFFGHNVTWYLT